MSDFARFYNAGDTITERFPFSMADGPDIHAVAHATVKLEARAFTDVPLERQVGVAIIRLPLDKDVIRRFGQRGVILVDRNLKPERIQEGEPLAVSDADAKARGEDLWRGYLHSVVMRYEEEAAQIRAQGGGSRVPAGFTRRAYTLLGLTVPGDEKLQPAAARSAAPDPRVDALERELAELRRMVAANGSGQPAAPVGETAGLGLPLQPPVPQSHENGKGRR